MADLLEFLTFVSEQALLVIVYRIVPAITENPILLLMSGIVFLGACVGIFGRLLSRG